MLTLLRRLFGMRAEPAPMRDLRELGVPLAAPGLQLIPSSRPARSHLGGAAGLPDGLPWPSREGRPLAFLARLSLGEIQSALSLPWLPSEGALLFFYDLDEQPWGFDPKDRGCCAVLHVSDLPMAMVPPGNASRSQNEPLDHCAVEFRRIETLPSLERASVRDLALSDREMEAWLELADAAYGGVPKHQVAGFPAAVQGDAMELECQLASNGVYCGDPSGYANPRVAELEPGAAAWRLLFQFDTDDALNVMWGDCGTIYFWVNEDEATRGCFDGVWLILQCH